MDQRAAMPVFATAAFAGARSTLCIWLLCAASDRRCRCSRFDIRQAQAARALGIYVLGT
jgi:hypothetical protein